MLDKTQVKIDGNNNIVIQNSEKGSTITINPDNSKELTNFLLDFQNQLKNLPLDIVELIEEKSKNVNPLKIEKEVRLHLSNYVGVSIHSNKKIFFLKNTILNLKQEIRYFNEPYFKVYPKIELLPGYQYDTIAILQEENLINEFPTRLEFGQPISSYHTITSELIDILKKTEQIDDAYIKSFTTTTIGEVFSSDKYYIKDLIKDYETFTNNN